MIRRIGLAAAILAAPAAASAQAAAPPAMQGMAMPAPTAPTTSSAMAPADAKPPPPPTDHYADHTYGAATMASSRAAFQQENGGQTFSQIMVNLAEVQLGDGTPTYRWNGEGWFGGDISRFVVKSEGSDQTGSSLWNGEVQALYSRAIGPYFDLQAGARERFGPTPARTDFAVGFEGLAPYWFEVEGTLFLSTRGDLMGRIEGYYDQYLTQRLVLQPRVELNFAAQNVAEDRIGAGLSEAALGLRLRYEIRREFAPYVGVSWDRDVGQTANYARALGGYAAGPAMVLGVRTWF